MATVYVSNAGNNSYSYAQAQNPDTPWLTLQYAVDNATTGDTIKIVAGIYTIDYIYITNTNSYTIQTQNENDIVTMNSSSSIAIIYIAAAATGSITFSGDIRWVSSTCFYAVRSINSNTGSGIMTFTGNSFTVTGVGKNLLNTGTAASSLRKFIFNNCNMSVADSSSGWAACLVSNVAEVTFDGCTIIKSTTAEASAFIKPIGATTLLQVKNCTITSDIQNIIDLASLNANFLDRLVIRGNTITGGKATLSVLDENVGLITIEDNEITPSAEGNVIEIGLNLHDTPSYYIYNPIIKGNTIIKTGTSGHIVRIGTNVRGGVLENNYFSNTDEDDYGLVIKSNFTLIEYNVIYSGYPIYLCGGNYNLIKHNTFCAIADAAFLINKNYDVAGVGNTITNNLMDGSGGAYGLRIIADEVPASWDNFIDYNAYLGVTAAVAINSNSYNTIESLTSAWESLSASHPDNDSHSIMPVSAGFVDVPGLDFRLLPSSLCINKGEHTAQAGYTSIGGWQRKSMLGNK